MKANNDSGKVIVKKKTVTKKVYYSRVGMSACRHANGKDWWLVKQANTVWSTSSNHISGFKCDSLADVADQVRDIEN